MAEAWPASLPQTAFIDAEERAEPNVIDTEVGSGPQKRRRRSTRERVFQSTTMELTGTQMTTFNTFWAAIKHGADSFTWTDLLTGSAATFRFLNKPRWKLLTPAPLAANRRYSGVLELERM